MANVICFGRPSLSNAIMESVLLSFIVVALKYAEVRRVLFQISKLLEISRSKINFFHSAAVIFFGQLQKDRKNISTSFSIFKLKY